jgi:uncharacterized membrane protein YheB (UPF0754 family)
MVHWIFLLSVPFITAFIGWITNRLAIRMLFHPRAPIGLFGLEWQGLIPKRQADIARHAAEVIEREVLSQHLLRNEIDSIDFEEYIGAFTRQVIHDKLGDKLRGIPLIGPFLNEATLNNLARLAGQEMKKQAPYLKHRISCEIEERLPIRTLIESRIAAFDVFKLEDLVYAVAAREFRAIEYFGAIFGFVVGLLQLLILLVAGFLRV